MLKKETRLETVGDVNCEETGGGLVVADSDKPGNGINSQVEFPDFGERSEELLAETKRARYSGVNVLQGVSSAEFRRRKTTENYKSKDILLIFVVSMGMDFSGRQDNILYFICFANFVFVTYLAFLQMKFL